MARFFYWLLAALFFLLPPLTQPALANASISTAEILCPEQAEPPHPHIGEISTPDIAEACLPYPSENPTKVIKTITPLRPTNYVANGPTNQPQLTPGHIRVTWRCQSGHNLIENICYDNKKIADPAAVEVGYAYSKDQIMFSTSIAPSNIYELTPTVSTDSENLIEAGSSEDDETETGTPTRPSRRTMVSVCSNGSFVYPPSACPRRS